MGSHSTNLTDEDLCCPVCKKALSTPTVSIKPKYLKTGRAGKNNCRNLQLPSIHPPQRDRTKKKMAIGKSADNEEIVIAQCGHLYHKFCLRHYCFLVREGRSNPSQRISCPSCYRIISMSSQAIDYKAHFHKVAHRDRDHDKVSIMNNELNGQLAIVKKRLQSVQLQIEEGNTNFDLYRAHWKKFKKELKGMKSKKNELEGLYSEVERSEQMLRCMQNQQLKIVRKFIKKVKEKSPSDFIHFPRRLAPYLDLIEEDDRLVRDLGEIIAPIHLNHLKSDRQSLLRGLIKTVQQKLEPDNGSIEAITADENASKRKNKQAVFAKGRKSSMSFFSTASHTKNWIQHIPESVNQPPHPGLDKGETKPVSFKQTKKRMIIAESVPEESNTDIQILYMPKKDTEPEPELTSDVANAETFASIPTRKCHSTAAVLVKAKKQACHLNKGLSKTHRLNKTSGLSLVWGNMVPKGDKGVSEKYTCTTPSVKKSVELLSLGAQMKTRKTPSHMATQPNSGGDYEGKRMLQKSSLLKLIYDALDNDRKARKVTCQDPSTDKDKCPDSKANVVTVGENIGIPFPPLPPQLFELDGHGIARPQSAGFRQPSFLTTVNPVEKFSLFASLKPDIENQLTDLSPEETDLLISEYETHHNSLVTSSPLNRVPLFHGTPARFNFTKGQPRLEKFPHESHATPIYLRKWQEQLATRKVVKACSKQFDNASPLNRLIISPRRQRRKTGVSPKTRITLPPISMFPSKRPSTELDYENANGLNHMEGPDLEKLPGFLKDI